jgi:hypothetical protein
VPTVQFTTTSGSANEGNSGTSTVTVQATLSAASTQAVTVPITYSGTATLGTDYTNAVTTLTIAAGQVSGSATLVVVGDTAVEPDETVILTMGTPTNAALGTNTVYTHTIVNDDPAPPQLPDYSNAGASPTLVAFASANNRSTLTLSNTVGGSDTADYVRFSVPAGERLSSFKLTGYDSTDGVAFIGIQAGTAVTATAQNASALKGYTHFGPGASGASVGSELVTKLGGPFEPGDYSVWIQQLGATTNYAFTLLTEQR